MKAGTGNRLTESLAKESILSIRFSPDGLSFCASRLGRPLWFGQQPPLPKLNPSDWLAAAAQRLDELQLGFPRIRVLVETDRMCLIPEEFYDPSADFMAVSDIFPDEDSSLLQMRREKMVIQFYASRSFHQALAGHFPDARIEYIHPLWIGIRRALKASGVDIHLGERLVHLVIAREGKLEYADTLRCDGVGELLFALGKLYEVFDLRSLPLLFSGHQSDVRREEVARFYKGTALDLPLPSKALPGVDIPRFANLIRAAYENY